MAWVKISPILPKEVLRLLAFNKLTCAQTFELLNAESKDESKRILKAGKSFLITEHEQIEYN